MKRERWIVDFPPGSAWREVRELVKDVARLRRSTVGRVALEALQNLVTQEHPDHPEFPPKKGGPALPLGVTVRLSKNKK